MLFINDVFINEVDWWKNLTDIFIIYERQVESYGIKKMKYLLVCSSIIVPVLHMILYELTFPLEPPWVYIFVPQSNSTFENLENGDSSLDVGGLIEDNNCILYTLTLEYLPLPLVHAIRILCYFMISVICLNVVEGFIYFHLYIIRFRR